jgi:hypothetical protein
VRDRTPKRRATLRARIKDAGSLAAFLEVLGMAEASRFCREDMSGFAFDWLTKSGNFTKVREGNYADGRRGRSAPAPTGSADALREVAEAFRQRQHGAAQ